MFKRVSYEEWADMVPIIAFFLTFGVFIYFVVRALRMKRSKIEHMANLPLEEDNPKEIHHHSGEKDHE